MNGSSESRKEATDRKTEVLSAKKKTGIGFWNVCTMYETGTLAQVPAEMRRYKLHILGGEPEKVDCIGRGGGQTTTTGETMLYSGCEDNQYQEGVAIILWKGMKK